MQQKNLIAFVVLSVLVLVGWTLLMSWLAPKKKGLEAVQWEHWPRQAQNEYAATRLLTTPAAGWSGLDGAVRLATDLRLFPNLPSPPTQPSEPAPVVASAPRPQPPAHYGPPVVLGGDGFDLQVTLTPKGAGVEQVVLTHFQDADRLGLPVKNGDQPVPLPLVPRESNRLQPSNILLHYPKPEEKNPEHPEADLGELEWTLQLVKNGKEDDVQEAVFTCDVPDQNVRLTKIYTLAKGDYHIGLTIRMEQKQPGKQPVPFRYQLTGAHGLPIEGEWYTTVYRTAMIGRGNSRSGFYRDVQDAGSIGVKDGGEKLQPPEDSVLRYAAVATQYFASAVVVDDVQAKGVKENFLEWARPTLEARYPNLRQQFLDDITVRVVSKPIQLKPGEPVEHRFLLYNGPVKVAQLAYLEDGAIGSELAARYTDRLHLNTLTDYGRVGWWSDLLVACTNVMHWLLTHILWALRVLHIPWAYGIAIMLLTVVVRGIMFPLSRRQTGATVRMQEKMAQLKKDLAPELRKLEEKYRDDPWKKRQAEHELYAKHGVNPAAMLNSCWLMFAQLPIFLGLYYALQESILFRLKPFLWVRNLSAPDMLFYWGEHIPYISDWSNLGSFPYLGPYFNLLPVVWVVLMFFQQKMMTPPAADEQQEMQQKMMKFMLVAFFYFFYKVPAGLCIYYIGSMLWTLGERKLLPKAQTAAGPAPVPQSNGRRATSPPAGAGRSRSRRVPETKGNGTVQRMRDLWAEVLKQAKKK
jgi:YidC/Oxa1 family membrane protein insertase